MTGISIASVCRSVTYAIITVPLATVLSIAIAAPASAQRIDEYLNPAVPGFNVEPGVTVKSRLRPEYDYQGLRLGSFIFHSEAAESIGYETNVTATQPAHGSTFLDTSATAQAVSDWGSNSLGAAVSVNNNLYFDQPRQTDTNWTAALGGSYDFGSDTLYVAYAHLNLNETPSDLGVPQLDAPITYRVDTGRISFRTVFGKGAITPGLEVTNFSYDNGTVQGVPYNQSYRNRVVITPSAVAAYQFDFAAHRSGDRPVCERAIHPAAAGSGDAQLQRRLGARRHQL